jgi:hypothetical protein
MTAVGVGMSGNGRRISLLLIVALHVLAAWLWPSRSIDSKHAPQRETAISFITHVPPAIKPSKSKPSALARTPVRNIPRAPTRVRSEPELTLVPAPAEPLATTPPTEAPEKTADEILQQARADVGKIDRDLRSVSPDKSLRKIVLHPTKLESSFAAAFKERGPQRMEEIIGPDGRRITKVGNMCAFKESNGLVGGRDVFKDGVKTRWQSCPK